MNPVQLVFTASLLLGVCGIARMLLAIYAHYWHHARWQEVDEMPKFNCTRFHEIQSRPKPLGVRINDWLEVHHV